MAIIPSTTTLKTLSCHFSQYRIYPGHGTRYFGVNGKTFQFLNGKARSMTQQKKKAQKIKWTPSWRIIFRKLKLAASGRNRKSKGDAAPTRSIAGLAQELRSQ